MCNCSLYKNKIDDKPILLCEDCLEERGITEVLTKGCFEGKCYICEKEVGEKFREDYGYIWSNKLESK